MVSEFDNAHNRKATCQCCAEPVTRFLRIGRTVHAGRGDWDTELSRNIFLGGGRHPNRD